MQIPVNAPDSARGTLEITYLDEDLRSDKMCFRYLLFVFAVFRVLLLLLFIWIRAGSHVATEGTFLFWSWMTQRTASQLLLISDFQFVHFGGDTGVRLVWESDHRWHLLMVRRTCVDNIKQVVAGRIAKRKTHLQSMHYQT